MGQPLSAVRTALELDGKEVGYCLNFSWDMVEERAKIYPIGQKNPVEATYVGSDVGGMTASMVRITDEDLAARGLIPGGRATVKEHIDWPPMTAVIRDKVNGKVQNQIHGVYMTGGSWTVAARGLVGENVTFIGLGHAFGSELGQ